MVVSVIGPTVTVVAMGVVIRLENYNHNDNIDDDTKDSGNDITL